MDWDSGGLLQKATSFFRRGVAQRAVEPGLQPLWYAMGLELLARAALAKFNPVLLAQLSGKHLEVLCFAVGVPTDARAVQISVAEVFARCQRVVDGFDESDVNFCCAWLDRRNRDLHTARSAFADTSSRDWQPPFFKAVLSLTQHLESSLPDLFGEEAGAAGAELAKAATEQRKGEAARLVQEAHARFSEMGAERRDELVRTSRVVPLPSEEGGGNDQSAVRRACPACGSLAWVTGIVRDVGEVYSSFGVPYRKYGYVPSRLECGCCGLRLAGYEYLHDLGDVGEPYELQRMDISALQYAPLVAAGIGIVTGAALGASLSGSSKAEALPHRTCMECHAYVAYDTRTCPRCGSQLGEA